MNDLERNPWQGLTSSQVAELDEQLLRPERRGMSRVDVWNELANEYAMRCATLLVSNDLRGALHAGEISAAARTMAERERFNDETARERIERARAAEPTDPRGRLTYVPGKHRLVRVRDDDRTPESDGD